MSRKNYTTEQIIAKLREAEVLHSQGSAIEDICKKLGITNQTYYRCGKNTGG